MDRCSGKTEQMPPILAEVGAEEIRLHFLGTTLNLLRDPSLGSTCI